MPVIVNKIGEHKNADAVTFLINYMSSSPYAGYAGGRGVVSLWPNQVIHDFNFVKALYEKEDHKLISHIIIGTDKKEQILETELSEMAETITDYFFERGFQSFYVTHRGSGENAGYLHLHLAINTINFLNGNRYYETYGNASDIKNILSMKYNEYQWFLINDNSQSWEE